MTTLLSQFWGGGFSIGGYSNTVHQDVGIDDNKGIKGRKRHIMGHSLVLLMVAVVTAANVDDVHGATPLRTERISGFALSLGY